METLEIVSHKCVTATSDEGPSLALEACYDLHIGRPLWMAENNDVILTDPEVSLVLKSKHIYLSFRITSFFKKN